MRKLLELSNEEIKSLVEENDRLKEVIHDETVENEMFWIKEELHFLKGTMSDYHIGTYGRNYMLIDDYEYAIQGFNMIDETFSGNKDFIIQLDKCNKLRENPEDQKQFENEVEKLKEIKLKEYKDRLEYRYSDNELYDFLVSNEDFFDNLYIDNMGRVRKMIAA